MPSFNNAVGQNHVAHQPQPNQVNLGQGPAPQGPVQFRSGNKPLLTRIAEKLGLQQAPATGGPNPALTVVTPSKRQALSNNLFKGRELSMGKLADRTNVAGHRLALVSSMKFFANGRMHNSPRLDTDYTVTNAKGQDLKGFSISADPNSSQLDPTRPVVLYFSGSGGTAEKYGAEIGKNYAENQNCNFVAVNYRGYGESEAINPSETSIAKDGMTMINHLIQQGFPPDKIIVHGYSMGASVAAHVQARVEESGYQLRGVVYDRPMSSATGAAHDYAADTAKGMWDNKVFKGIAGAIGTAIAKVSVDR